MFSGLRGMSKDTYECDRCHKAIETGSDWGPYDIDGSYLCQPCFEEWQDGHDGKDGEEQIRVASSRACAFRT